MANISKNNRSKGSKQNNNKKIMYKKAYNTWMSLSRKERIRILQEAYNMSLQEHKNIAILFLSKSNSFTAISIHNESPAELATLQKGEYLPILFIPKDIDKKDVLREKTKDDKEKRFELLGQYIEENLRRIVNRQPQVDM